MDKEARETVEKKIHRAAVFQRVFTGPEGEEALKLFDDITGYRANTFDTDPYKNAYNAGVRSVALFIHNVLDGDVEKARKILEQGE